LKRPPYPPIEPTAEPTADSGNDHDEASFEALKALFEKMSAKKKEKLLQTFPILKGQHEAFVKHPSQLHPGQWEKWSLKLIAEKYALYTQYVDNWYAGKNGKEKKAASHEWTDADEASFLAAMAVNAAYVAKLEEEEEAYKAAKAGIK
jgi:hypothetical protein